MQSLRGYDGNGLHLRSTSYGFMSEKKNKGGRPPKTINSINSIKGLSRKAIERAKLTHKLLPHELLLLWANGIEVANLKPTPAQQLYSAVAAAPFYAPKLANVEVKQDVRLRAVISAQPMTQEQWSRKYLNTQDNVIDSTPKQLDSEIESENYFTKENMQGGEGVPRGTVSQQPIEGLLGKVVSPGIDSILSNPMQALEFITDSSDSEAGGQNSETNRKSSNDVYISPPTAHANLSCSTDTNDVCEDDDDDTL
jgi:hypothetical protein